jgi:hypothetical protein
MHLEVVVLGSPPEHRSALVPAPPIVYEDRPAGPETVDEHGSRGPARPGIQHGRPIDHEKLDPTWYLGEFGRVVPVHRLAGDGLRHEGRPDDLADVRKTGGLKAGPHALSEYAVMLEAEQPAPAVATQEARNEQRRHTGAALHDRFRGVAELERDEPPEVGLDGPPPKRRHRAPEPCCQGCGVRTVADLSREPLLGGEKGSLQDSARDADARGLSPIATRAARNCRACDSRSEPAKTGLRTRLGSEVAQTRGRVPPCRVATHRPINSTPASVSDSGRARRARWAIVLTGAETSRSLGARSGRKSRGRGRRALKIPAVTFLIASRRMTLRDTSLDRRGLRVRVRGSIARRGITGTAKYGAVTLGHRIRRRAFYVAETAFDLWHGVETRGIFHQDESAVQADPVFAHAKHYGGTYPRSFRRYIRALGIDYRKYTFVDLGSGKGKALLLAAEYPFRRVIGVELWEPWAADAERNLASAKRFRSAAGAIELVQGDAATYAYPSEPLVVYVHNSFDAVLMNTVVEALTQSLISAPRDLYLIYHGPWQRHVTDRVTLWEPVAEFRKCVIYHATEAFSAAAAATQTSTPASTSVDRG